MGILIELLDIYIPVFLKKRKLLQLFSATADAFGVTMPPMNGLRIEDCLKEYARFTRDEAARAICNGAGGEVKQRLYRNAYRLGSALRGEFGVKNMNQAMKLAHTVYQVVGINFMAGPRGDVVISRCYFTDFYSSEVCSVISSLDAGLISGLTAGGRLTFSQRLTEGNDCCFARISHGVKST